ncbi:hypothetical protein [Methylosinus sp. Sm6]|uniref:hypothetical protein n=1 Tax=Methylosinus sp. Sm6 TaxID=2866948 RepID=UPI001C9A1490|nr:hypothetical protein [Methylosinus sp. Sm6]MBY6240983.1 hypothetical protein [Methylosinus sp. Sm6]
MTLLRLPVSLMVFYAVLSSARAQNGDDDRWRYDASEDMASLVRAASEGTDLVGRFAFNCRLHSGEVEATLLLDKADLAEIGELIKRDDYPAFEMLPDQKGVDFKIESSPMYGWILIFNVDAASEFMRSFGRSGELRYRLDKTSRRYGTTAGKTDAAAFVEACSKT